MSLPPDRGHLSTEAAHARSRRFDMLSTTKCVELMAGDSRGAVNAVKQATPALTRFIEVLVEHMGAGGRLIYLGAGTSGRLGVLDASECPPTFQSDPDRVVGIIAGGDASLRRSSEGKEDEPRGAHAELRRLRVGAGDVVLGIAAGGTTPYVLGAIEFAAARGALTGLLTCAAVRKPASCDHLIHLPTGPELLTGSTRLKAGTATKLALNIITTVTFTKLGKVYGNLMVDLRATNSKLRDRAIRILTTLCPELSRASAAALLKRAKGDLKTAIVMQRRSVSCADATSLLDAADRNLRAALNPSPRPRRPRPRTSPASKATPPPRRRR